MVDSTRQLQRSYQTQEALATQMEPPRCKPVRGLHEQTWPPPIHATGRHLHALLFLSVHAVALPPLLQTFGPSSHPHFEQYTTVTWGTHHWGRFIYFHPSLTSLTLRRPTGSYRLLLQFALQFPNLENLCLEEWSDGWATTTACPIIIDKLPPLCGNLRLAGFRTIAGWPTRNAYGLSDGMNFQTVELEDFFGDQAQRILNACAHTLENLTIAPQSIGKH